MPTSPYVSQFIDDGGHRVFNDLTADCSRCESPSRPEQRTAYVETLLSSLSVSHSLPLSLPLRCGCALKPEWGTVRATLSKRPCHLACWLWAGPYPASISLHFQSQALWGRIRERERGRMEGGARRRRGFTEDQSDPPDAWILSIGGPSGQMCRICRHLCSAAVREDLLACLSPDVCATAAGHVSGSGDTERDLMQHFRNENLIYFRGVAVGLIVEGSGVLQVLKVQNKTRHNLNWNGKSPGDAAARSLPFFTDFKYRLTDWKSG